MAPVAPVKPRKPRSTGQNDRPVAIPPEAAALVLAARPAEPAPYAAKAPVEPRKKPRPAPEAAPAPREPPSGWHPDNKPGKPKSQTKPGKPAKRAQNAADTSRRFTPPTGSTPARAGDSPGFAPYKKRPASGTAPGAAPGGKPKGKQGGFAKPRSPKPGKPGGKGN